MTGIEYIQEKYKGDYIKHEDEAKAYNLGKLAALNEFIDKFSDVYNSRAYDGMEPYEVVDTVHEVHELLSDIIKNDILEALYDS
jgi:hypothetical protein